MPHDFEPGITQSPDEDDDLFSAGETADETQVQNNDVLARTPSTPSRQFPFFTYRGDDTPGEPLFSEDAYDETWEMGDLPSRVDQTEDTDVSGLMERAESEADEDAEIFSPPRVGTRSTLDDRPFRRSWFVPIADSTPRSGSASIDSTTKGTSTGVLGDFLKNLLRKSPTSKTSTVDKQDSIEVLPPSTSSSSNTDEAAASAPSDVKLTRTGRAVKPPLRFQTVQSQEPKKPKPKTKKK
jgi:hypothetical protein